MENIPTDIQTQTSLPPIQQQDTPHTTFFLKRIFLGRLTRSDFFLGICVLALVQVAEYVLYIILTVIAVVLIAVFHTQQGSLSYHIFVNVMIGITIVTAFFVGSLCFLYFIAFLIRRDRDAFGFYFPLRTGFVYAIPGLNILAFIYTIFAPSKDPATTIHFSDRKSRLAYIFALNNSPVIDHLNGTNMLTPQQKTSIRTRNLIGKIAGIFIGSVLVMGLFYVIYHYFVFTLPLEKQIAKEAGCAIKSSTDPLYPNGILCRDKYRTDFVKQLEDTIYLHATDNVVTAKSHVNPYRNSTRAGEYPETIFEQDNDPQAGKNIQMIISSQLTTYLDQSLCQPVLTPDGTVGTCTSTLPSLGYLHSSPTTTAYFYIPFNGKTALAPEDIAAFNQEEFNGYPDGFLLGACLENTHIIVFSPDRSLYMIVSQNQLTTTGPKQLTVECF